MSLRTLLPAIAATLLGSLAMGSAGFAQDARPAHRGDQGQGVMGSPNPSLPSQGMMGSTGNMANMMRQMTREMENCARMMEQNSLAPEKAPVAQNLGV